MRSSKEAGSSVEGAAAAADLSSPATGGAGLFFEGEMVLAYHCSRIYDAKVQKTELLEDEWRYLVHYRGWSKNWDEWVGTDRLLKVTEENVRKKQELAKNHDADKNPKSSRSAHNTPKGSIGLSLPSSSKLRAKISTSKSSSLALSPCVESWRSSPASTSHSSPDDAELDKEDLKTNVVRGKKQKVQTGIKEKDTKSLEKLMTLQFPPTLKKQLAHDWQFVTQLGRLVKLPRSPNVDDILKKYLDDRTKKDGMIAGTVGEILDGLRCYFDKALLVMLLYKRERQQYHEVVGDNVSPSTIYGAEHLLRLFVKLPELLAYVHMEEEAQAKLQQQLLDFLKFLQKNQSSFFLSTYDGPKGVDEIDGAHN